MGNKAIYASCNRKKKRSGSTTPRSASRRGSKLNLDDSQVEEMLSKLKKENYELRNERNDLRKDRDNLATQLNSAKGKIKKLEDMAGGDDALLKLLAQARADQRATRKQNKQLRQKELQLMGLTNALRKKLMDLAKKVGKYDPEKGQRIIKQKDPKGMIDELATQYTEMIDKFERSQEEVKKLKKRLKDQQTEHEV